MLFALALAIAIQTTAPAGVTGVLKDEAGRPLARTKVLACMTRVCLIGETGADGRFSFSIDPPVDVVIKTEPDLAASPPGGASPRRGAGMMPVRLAERRVIDVGSVYVPSLPAGRPFGPGTDDPQTVQAGDGLQLTLSRKALKPRPGDVIVELAARRLPVARVPKYAALGGEDVIAVYALHPFAAVSATPIAVRAASSLADGTRVNFRTINEIDGTFSAPVPGQAARGYLATDPGAGITELTWLVISRPARSR
jgi:hypothetical protein